MVFVTGVIVAVEMTAVTAAVALKGKAFGAIAIAGVIGAEAGATETGLGSSTAGVIGADAAATFGMALFKAGEAVTAAASFESTDMDLITEVGAVDEVVAVRLDT